MNNLSPAKKALIIETINLLKLNKINALPMKLYSDDDDVDVVIINTNQYEKATKVLLTKKWYIKNNRSKLRERDKDFFHHRHSEYLIHLHKAFSWNTVTYLSSKTLWERKRVVNEIIMPSIEDELLIIAAHSLFENQYIKEEEVLYAKELLENRYNTDYMKEHAAKFNWQIGLSIVIEKLKDSKSSLSISELLLVKTIKLKQDFQQKHYRQFLTEIFNYFLIDWIWNYRLMLQKKIIKHPLIITLSGVDGSGKTTNALFLEQEFKKINKKVKIIHTGTTPFIKQDLAQKKYKFLLIGYLSLIKDYMRILFSFLANINYEVIIFDRYIYDSLVKISYKQKQKKINKYLFFLFTNLLPKPKLALFLKISPKLSSDRDKDHLIEYHNEKSSLYNDLFSYLPKSIKIDTGKMKKTVEENIKIEISRLVCKNVFENNRPETNFKDELDHEHSREWEIASLKKRRNLEIRRKRILQFDIKNNSRILDLGCGDGLNINIFRKLGLKNIVGIDTSEYLLRYAKINNPKIRFVLGSGENMPFPDKSFDVVFIDSVLHHLPEFKKIITEIKRVLASRGQLCFIEPHKTWLRDIVNWLTMHSFSEIVPFFKKRRATYSEERYMNYWLENQNVFFKLLENNGFRKIMLKNNFLSIMGKYVKNE